MRAIKLGLMAALLAGAASAPAIRAARRPAQRMERVPDRQPGEGEGPFRRLVIRGAMLIDGTGAPPRGPVDIVIAGNRIESIAGAGTPGLPLGGNREPPTPTARSTRPACTCCPASSTCTATMAIPTRRRTPATATGSGSRTASPRCAASASMTARTTCRSRDRARSAANTIVAPRLFAYIVLGDGWSGGDVNTPEQARACVRWAAAQGYDGIKFFNDPPAITRAAIEEARRLRLGTVAHLGQGGVAEVNADVAGAMGLGTVTHFYGHFEALLRDRRLPAYPNDYNMFDEQWRFSQVARLADQIVEPGGPEWSAYLQRQLERGVTFNPTFNIYSAGRDVMRARNADWHARYTLPSLQRFFEPSRINHGSYFWDWTTADEVAWRRFYGPYMRLMNDYKNMGGRVTVGSDPGYIYQTWGFSYIQELEMLQEAGFSPLEVIQAATINGAREIYAPRGEEPPFGLVRPGMLADLVIVPGNPLENLKLLYGTGHMRLNPETQRVERVGGVRWTIKDGIVYDARALLASVERMVAEQRAREDAR